MPHRAAGGGGMSVCASRGGEGGIVCTYSVCECGALPGASGVCGSIFISGCQGGDTLMNGAE